VNEAKAAALVADAEKKLAPSTWSFFSSRSGKVEEATELLDRAGNFYKLAKNFAKAGEVYKRAASCQEELGNKYEHASYLVKAATTLRQAGLTADAASVLSAAATLFAEEGRFAMAAKHQKDLAELWEQAQENKQAQQAFMTAADLYDGENSSSSANGCRLKAADLAATLKEYASAAVLFEKVAQGSVGNKLLQWSVKDYLLKAALCLLAQQDLVAAKRALSSYSQLSSDYAASREATLAQDLLTALEQRDEEAFTNAVQEFDKSQRLDAWKTSILLDIKASLEAAGNDVDLT